MEQELRELLAQKNQVLDQAEAILHKAKDEKRELNEAEQTQYNEFIVRAETTQKGIEQRQKIAELRGKTPEMIPLDGANIGMSEGEIKNYSILRAIRAQSSKDWRGAELEREASEATAKLLGKDPAGFFAPADWLRGSKAEREQRDLTVGSATAGGYFKQTQQGPFIEMLRNKSLVMVAGATLLTGLVGDLAIPAQSGGATAYWVAENGDVTESAQTVGQVLLQPKTVGAWTNYSRKLMQQSSIDIDNFVKADLAACLQTAIDLAALHGTGDNNQPTGIALTTGIGSIVGGENGAAPTWANIVGLETEVSVDNADIGNLAYMTNPKVRGKLKVTPKVASTETMIWNENSLTPLNGYRAHVTNQVRSNLTKGNQSLSSGIFFGNWADLLIAMWGALDIMADPYTLGSSGGTRVIALHDVDIAPRRAVSFSAMLDALTA